MKRFLFLDERRPHYNGRMVNFIGRISIDNSNLPDVAILIHTQNKSNSELK